MLVRIFSLFLIFIAQVFFSGKAIAKAGGQQLRDAVADVAKTANIDNSGDGKSY